MSGTIVTEFVGSMRWEGALLPQKGTCKRPSINC